MNPDTTLRTWLLATGKQYGIRTAVDYRWPDAATRQHEQYITYRLVSAVPGEVGLRDLSNSTGYTVNRRAVQRWVVTAQVDLYNSENGLYELDAMGVAAGSNPVIREIFSSRSCSFINTVNIEDLTEFDGQDIYHHHRATFRFEDLVEITLTETNGVVESIDFTTLIEGLLRNVYFPCDVSDIVADGSAGLSIGTAGGITLSADTGALVLTGLADLLRAYIMACDTGSLVSVAAADLLYGRTLSADTAATVSTGLADLLCGRALSADTAATVTTGSADLLHNRVLVADMAALVASGEAVLDASSNITWAADMAALVASGSADLLHDFTLSADTGDTVATGAADLLHGFTIDADTGALVSTGSADLFTGLRVNAEMGALVVSGTADLLHDVVVSADIGDAVVSGAADVLHARTLAADIGDTVTTGAAALLCGRAYLADIGDTVATGLADLLHAYIVDADTGDTVADGEATLTIASSQTVHFVDLSATGSADGSSWTDAYTDIDTAISAASDGEWVLVKENATAYTDTPYLLKAGVRVLGGFASSLTGVSYDVGARDLDNDITTISAGDSGACLTFVTDAEIDGFWVTDGAANPGGAISHDSGTVDDCTVANCTFDDNASAGYGGAILLRAHEGWVFSDCTFSNNSGTTYGGAVTLRNGCEVAFNDCTFDSNASSGAGGAVAIRYTGNDVEFNDCVFTGNEAQGGSGGGGAVYSAGGPVDFTDCSFDSNDASAASGGCCHITGSTSTGTYLRCRFDNNDAWVHGTVIYNDVSSTINLTLCLAHGNSDASSPFYAESTGTMNILQCTFSANVCSDGSGGCVDCDTGSTVDVKNTILWNNDPTEIIADGTFTCTYSDIDGGYSGTGNVNDDPNFLGSGDDPYQLDTTSDAVDAADSGSMPAADILGRSWVTDDMGCYRFSS
ncbi:MAG: hypothetical protein GY835_28470 [bacterium]|nr:hypothetical protein [bacterium]